MRLSDDFLERWGCTIAICLSLLMWVGIIGLVVLVVRKWLA